MKKIRVMIARSTEKITGPETLLLSILKELDYSRIKVFLVLLTKDQQDLPFYNEVGKIDNPGNDLTVRIIRNSGKMKSSTIKQLRSFIIDNRIDIVHANEHKTDILCYFAGRKTSARLLSFVHGYLNNPFHVKVYEIIDWFIIKFYHKIIVGSHALAKFLIGKGVKEHKITVIQNAISSDAMDNPPKTNEEIRKSFGINQNDILIGIVGRLGKEKGHRYLLDAFAVINKQLPNTKLLVIGTGPEMDNLVEQAGRLHIRDSVIFTGFVDEIVSFFHTMDIFLLASLKESIPMVIYEAMLCEKPVVATNVGGISEVIEDGKTGIIIPSANSGIMSQKILQLIHNPEMKKKIAREGKKLAQTEITAINMTRNIEKVYNDLYIVYNL